MHCTRAAIRPERVWSSLPKASLDIGDTLGWPTRIFCRERPPRFRKGGPLRGRPPPYRKGSGRLGHAVGHVWTAPPWQELSDLLQHWSGAVMCPACLCGGEAAGHNAMRGSGPNQKHAFNDGLTHTGSPDPRVDLVCITSSCPRQFLQNFKRRRRFLASPP